MHGLEGARDDALASRVVFGPRVKVGLRHDGEDAETSAGLDVGGGLVVSDSSTGLAVDLRVRMLVLHQAEGVRERAMAASLGVGARLLSLAPVGERGGPGRVEGPWRTISL